MRKTGKIIEILIFAIAVVYVGYNLISGQMELTTKGYLLLFVFLPVVAILAFLDKKKDKSHRSAIEDTGRSGDEGGVIRTSFMLRGVLIFILLVFWGMVLIFSWLAYEDGAFADPSVRGPFGAVLVLLLIITLLIIVVMGSVWQEIYYDSQGVTVKRGFKKVSMSWRELGEAKVYPRATVFCDRTGKTLFSISPAQEEYQKIWEYYKGQER